MAGEVNEINFRKAMREARERFLQDCVGVGFQDAKGDWIQVKAVGTDGSVLLSDGVTNDPTAVVDRTGHEDLIRAIMSSAPQSGEVARSFLVAGEGERIVIDWPKVVLHSGYRVGDLLTEGVAFCLLNPRRSKEAWT